jgi:hypothetical protein
MSSQLRTAQPGQAACQNPERDSGCETEPSRRAELGIKFMESLTLFGFFQLRQESCVV